MEPTIQSQPVAAVIAFKGAGELVKSAWQVATKHWKAFVGIMAVPLLLNLITQFIWSAKDRSLAVMITGIVFLIVTIVCSVLMQLAVIGAARTYSDDPVALVSFKAQYAFGLKNFWSYIWVTILTGLSAMGLMVLFMIPIIVVAGLFMIIKISIVTYLLISVGMVVMAFGIVVYAGMSIYAFLFDGRKGLECISESIRIVRGRWWRVFWRVIVIGVVTLLLYIPLIIVGLVMTIGLKMPSGSIISIAISLILTLLTATVAYPLMYAYIYGLYRSLQSTAIAAPKPLISMVSIKVACWVGLVVGLLAIASGIYLGRIGGYHGGAFQSQNGAVASGQALFPAAAMPLVASDPSVLESKAYTDDTLGFSMQWPKGWQSQADANGIYVTPASSTDTKIGFAIQRRDLPTTVTNVPIETLMDQIARQAVGGSSGLAGASFEKDAIGPLDAYVVSGTLSVSGQSADMRYYFIPQGLKVYIITANASPDVWVQGEPLIIDSVSTFKIIE